MLIRCAAIPALFELRRHQGSVGSRQFPGLFPSVGGQFAIGPGLPGGPAGVVKLWLLVSSGLWRNTDGMFFGTKRA